MATTVFDPVPALVDLLKLPRSGVSAVVKLLSDGNTVPFIARYRKEMTGGLDEVAIRDIEEKAAYLKELESRRQTILDTIREQGMLTADLERRIRACRDKASLEDLYLPYKPKRRTRAMMARERGLAPLADRIAAQPRDGSPRGDAARFVDPEREVPDVDAALAGARDIVAERIAEEADNRAMVRDAFTREGVVRSRVAKGKESEGARFRDYFDYEEAVRKIPSHRFLALRRGESEGVLRVKIEIDAATMTPRLLHRAGHRPGTPFAAELATAAADALKRLLAPSVETDVRVDLKMAADRAAVEVFATNLQNKLLSAPVGERAILGIDPGLRTGCKCAMVDATGTLRDHVTIYPSRGAEQRAQAARTLVKLVQTHTPFAVAVGNGTGGRETEQFARKALEEAGLGEVVVVAVDEAGASVYSASDVAREEFPDLDLTVRGAISIARRLQDPLAELVKIDPKSIGVGQYQHDVHQPLLARKLDEVIETCVNRVGVELNTASAPLLSRVAGIGPTLAKRIVEQRGAQGGFRARRELLDVPGVGPRTFEQAAGFLRIRGAHNPLDASAVHPERYTLVERIAGDLGVPLARLVGDGEAAGRIVPERYVSDAVGLPTLKDIVAELEKPGRDPRDAFEPPRFREDVHTMDDLEVGMALEGVVTNVTDFGAFVDVGVHQDGLVHISKLADRFVRNPHDVVKVGDRITVRVLDVDLERRRISLSARSEPSADAERSRSSGGRDARSAPRSDGGGGRRRSGGGGKGKQPPAGGGKKPGGFRNNPFADLLKR